MSEVDKNLFIGQQAVNKSQAELITQKILRENILQEQIQNTANALNNASDRSNQLKKDAENWRERANIAAKKIKNLEEQVEFYKNLLAKPMAEIASQNESFKETYRTQQEFLASFMLSQKAFKELAFDLGLQLGRSKKELVDAAKQNSIKVLTNQTRHSNNAEDSTIITRNIEALRNKVKNT